MKIKILRTEQDYNKACQRIYALIHSTENDIVPDSSEGEELELLSLLVEKYEQEHYRMQAPSSIKAIKFRMEQMNLRQSDIASLFGGKTRASEVMNGKRALNLKMITLLNRYLGIPLESLVSENNEIKLEAGKKEELLNIPSIKEYMNNRRAALA